MTIVARVKPGDHRVVTNEANVASDALDPDLSNNDASATTAIRIADLAITKTSDADTYKPSSKITYTMTVINNGPGDANNVVVTDALPIDSKDRVAILDPSCTLIGTYRNLQPRNAYTAFEPQDHHRDHPEGQLGLHRLHGDRRELDVRLRHVEQLVDEGRPFREPAEAVRRRDGRRAAHCGPPPPRCPR